MFLTRRPMNLPLPGYLPTRDIDRIFTEMLGAFPMLAPLPAAFTASRAQTPAVNMWEDEHNVYVEAELPGLTMKDIDVSIDGGTLTIKAHRAETAVDEKTKVHRRERVTGEFGCAVSVPVEFDADKSSATIENGVLLVTLPKAAVARARKIEVKGK